MLKKVKFVQIVREHQANLEKDQMVVEQNHQTKVLIVVLPGMMETLLKRTLTNRSDVSMIGSASGGLSAVSMIKEELPDLVIIESNFPDNETTRLVAWIREKCQKTRTLVLVETTQQHNQASQAGADIILYSYALAEKLDQVIEKIKINPESGNGNKREGENHAS